MWLPDDDFMPRTWIFGSYCAAIGLMIAGLAMLAAIWELA